MNKNREDIHNQQIVPAIREIGKICIENGISFVAMFSIANPNSNFDLLSTSHHIIPEQSGNKIPAALALVHREYKEKLGNNFIPLINLAVNEIMQEPLSEEDKEVCRLFTRSQF